MKADLLLVQTEKAFLELRRVMESYAPISDDTWYELRSICDLKHLLKHEILYQAGEYLGSFSFVYSGLLRLFIVDESGHEYNKTFFDEGKFPGSMTALLRGDPSRYTFEALEESVLILIDFKAYRELLIKNNELKLYHIYYLEQNWLIEKDEREVEIVQENASQRYKRFLVKNTSLSHRIPQYHIASHLGITPTQLSRVRKKLSTK